MKVIYTDGPLAGTEKDVADHAILVQEMVKVDADLLLAQYSITAKTDDKGRREFRFDCYARIGGGKVEVGPTKTDAGTDAG